MYYTNIFIPLPKKGYLADCSNCRKIALVSHDSKILLSVIMNRLRNKMEDEVAEGRAGVRAGGGTRDQISNLRIIKEKAREFIQSLFFCFFDFTKAFDTVSHNQLWATMIDNGFPLHIVDIIDELFIKKPQSMVRTSAGASGLFKVKCGVRQGCILSPYLLNMQKEQ